MHMTFYWTTSVGDFFFEGLEVNGVLPLIVACGVTALASIVYEGVKVHSARIRARNARASISAVSCAPSESANFLINDRSSDRSSFSNKFCGLLGETCVFICHSSLSYAIMLSVMLYSGWLFVAAVVGMGLGYFLFGHISVRINMESAQARTTTIVCSTACPENAENGSVQAEDKVRSCCESIAQQCSENVSPAIAVCSTAIAEKATTNPTFQQEPNDGLANKAIESEDCCCRL